MFNIVDPMFSSSDCGCYLTHIGSPNISPGCQATEAETLLTERGLTPTCGCLLCNSCSVYPFTIYLYYLQWRQTCPYNYLSIYELYLQKSVSLQLCNTCWTQGHFYQLYFYILALFIPFLFRSLFLSFPTCTILVVLVNSAAQLLLVSINIQ